MTPAEIQAEINAADQTLKTINDHVNSALNNIIVSALPVVKDVLKFIHDRIADVSHAIERIVGQVTTTIGNTIQAALPGAVEFLTGIANDIFNDVHNILGNLATAEEVVSGAINHLKQYAGDAGNFLLGAIGSGIMGGLINVLEHLETEGGRSVDHLLDEIMAKPGAPPWFTTLIGQVKGRSAPIQALVIPFIVGAMLRPIGDALLDPWLKTVAYGSNKTAKTEVASPVELIEMRLKNIIDDALFYDEMALNNFGAGISERLLRARQQRMLPEELARLVYRGEWPLEAAERELSEVGIAPGRTQAKISSMRPLLTEDETRQTFLRGIIDRPKHDALMALHGYTPDVIDRKVRLYYLIPGPQDLIHMGIRNVFDPEIVREFELDKDAPKEFFAAAAQQGISQDWAAKYWQAHWVVPGIDQAFTMYQRVTDDRSDPAATTFTLLDGTRVQNIIGDNTLRLFLKDKDVPPYYRQRLTEIAYHPLNRIDVRRMYSVGSLDKAGVERAYLNLGYAPVNARLLADFVERYYAQTKKDKAQPILDGLRRQILRLYQQEKLDLSDAAFALKDLNFTDAETDLYLQEAKLLMQAEEAAQIEAGLGRIYEKGFIDEPAVRARLAKFNVPKAAIERLVAKWNLTIELNRDTEHFHKARDLTKTEVTEAYSDGQMTRDVAEAFFEQLGYPPNEAAILLNVADYRHTKATRTAMQDAIKALYVSGIRDELTTSNDLDTLGLPSQRRDALIAEWTLLRETRTEKIPIATLRDMYTKAKLLSRDQVFAHLKRHRYTDDDANLMLAYWSK